MVLCCILPGNLGAQPLPLSEPLEAAWRDTSTFLFNDANAVFSTAVTEPARERERRLGKAVTLFNVQPRTAANLAQAKEDLEALASGDDEAAIFATYFLARFHERYEDPPDRSGARRLYESLLEMHGGHPLAENGAAAVVLMELYEKIPASERGKRFVELENLETRLKTPEGRRNYHLNLGNAYIDFNVEPQKALDHLVAADREGIPRWQVEAETWIAIGELARTLGLNDLAHDYYARFLTKYQRDNRSYTIEKRLEGLAGKSKEAQ